MSRTVKCVTFLQVKPTFYAPASPTSDRQPMIHELEVVGASSVFPEHPQPGVRIVRLTLTLEESQLTPLQIEAAPSSVALYGAYKQALDVVG